MNEADPLDARIEMLRKMTKGTMPIVMVVADEDEKLLAAAKLAAKRGVSNIKLETRAEFDASRPGHMRERH